MLSKLGRGFNDVVVQHEKIYNKIDYLLKMASIPVMTDIEIGLTCTDLEVYPLPVPDLFMFSPVVAAVHYCNPCSSVTQDDFVVVKGFDANGEQKQISASIIETPHLPVDKILIKQKIDLLTAQAWFSQDKAVIRKVVQSSIEHCVPSHYTSLIAFETRKEKLEKHGLLGGHDEKERDRTKNSIVKSKTWAT
ncbi:hypothetical protein RFI_09901, partial [Reticulomyxa filosa]